ncbi:MAG TPA: histidine kinase [Caulobacteraceae bacterium]|jgi:two-component system sensor histidine kinase UhpB|nr:histidine kinase [Caulobacteraceae bacterium]
MSLRLRVVAAVVLLLLTGSVVGVALAGWQARQVLREELVAAVAGGRLTAIGAFQSLPRSDDPARDLARLVASFDGGRHLEARLVADDGTAVATSQPIPVRPAPSWFAALFDPDLASARLTVPAPGYRALVLMPVAANDVAALWSEFLDLVAVLGGSIALGAALVWLTVGRALRPLAEFSAAFVRIGSGDYAAKVREAGAPELARLGRGVNDMAARLGAMQARTHRLEAHIATLQDEERADLARDLHDEIGPHLFAVNVDAAMARRLVDEGETGHALGRLRAIEEGVGHMQRLVRDILSRLRPTQLVELGLAAAVGELVAFWAARHPDIEFRVDVPDDDDLGIGAEARETLYRIVQEALNNAVRHGRPAHVTVGIARDPDGEVVARVADDGAGGAAPEGAGFGLMGMRERVAAARGRLDIARGARGWTVTARLPAAAQPFEPADELEEAGAA